MMEISTVIEKRLVVTCAGPPLSDETRAELAAHADALLSGLFERADARLADLGLQLGVTTKEPE